MSHNRHTRITEFQIENIEGDGVNISGRGSIEISHGTIRNARNGIVISGAEPAEVNLLDLIKNLDRDEIIEIKRLIDQASTNEAAASAISRSSLPSLLFEKGLRTVDVIDKLIKIFRAIS